MRSATLVVSTMALLLGLAGAQAYGEARAAGRRPNVLLILTDDQGFGDIRSHGNPLIDTPTLDRLAAEGARFERFYVSPVCAPTRAALMSGRYHLRSGVHGVTRAHETMRSDELTLAEALKHAGYATGAFGKWHNGAHYPEHPNGQGFDTFLGFCGGHWNSYFDATLERNGEPEQTRGFITDVLTDEALKFIDTHKDRPFLCYVPYNAPHSPFQAPDRYFEKYKARGLDDTLACVYAMVENVDDNIARLLKRLDDHGIARDTIVVFLTDNGPNTDRFNGSMRGKKGSVHEGGVRVPLFVRWPGVIRPGTIVEPMAAAVDLMPTLLSLCGVSVPAGRKLDGVDLTPLLKGETAGWPDRALLTHWSGAEAVTPIKGALRTQRWALTLEKAGRYELWDLQADLTQKSPVTREHPQVVAELTQTYQRLFDDASSGGFDPVPVQIGHAQHRRVTLPGHEAMLDPAWGSGISYQGRPGFANDWITNWTQTSSGAWWPVKIVTGGRYEVGVLYAMPAEHAGSVLRVEVGGGSVERAFNEPHAAPVVPTADRAARKNEVPDREWKPLTLGVIELKPGDSTLRLVAVKINGMMPEIKAVTLTRVQ